MSVALSIGKKKEFTGKADKNLVPLRIVMEGHFMIYYKKFDNSCGSKNKRGDG